MPCVIVARTMETLNCHANNVYGQILLVCTWGFQRHTLRNDTDKSDDKKASPEAANVLWISTSWKKMNKIFTLCST